MKIPVSGAATCFAAWFRRHDAIGPSETAEASPAP